MNGSSSITRTNESALEILNSATHSTREREQAIHLLAKEPTPASIQRLIAALEDQTFGVRWEAAVALAALGDIALKPLLQALVHQHDSAWLREGAHHVFYYSSSPLVRERTQALLLALRGSAAELMTTDAAGKLLQTL